MSIFIHFYLLFIVQRYPYQSTLKAMSSLLRAVNLFLFFVYWHQSCVVKKPSDNAVEIMATTGFINVSFIS